jgi:type IV secretory pathway TrbD component
MRKDSIGHPVYRVINKPLTIWGADRRLFFLSLIIGAGTFTFFSSLLSGILMFLALYSFSLWTTGRDPQMLHVILNASKFKVRYDPAKHEGFMAQVVGSHGPA